MIAAAQRLWTVAMAGILAAVCLVAGASIHSVAATPPPSGTGLQIALPADGATFTDSPHGALLDTARLAPGHTADGVMGVRNSSGGPADVHLKMVDVSESAQCPADVHGCAGKRGSIRAALLFSVQVADSQSGSYTQVWSGSADDLANDVSVLSAVPDGATRWVRLLATLPAQAGNELEGVALHFGLAVTMSGVAGVSRQVLGAHDTRGISVFGLALTGTQLALLTAIALLALSLGLVFLLLGRSTRRDS